MQNFIYNYDLNQEVNELKHHISFFENTTNPKVVLAKEFGWDSFCRRMQKPKVSETKDVELFSPCRLNQNQTRGNSNVVEVTMLVFDIDDPQGKNAEDIIKLIPNWNAVLHTTWSHTPESPRYRLIIQLASPIPSAQFRSARDGFLKLNPELASIIDKACSDPSRAYYLFSYPTARSSYATAFVNQGRPVIPSDYIPLSNVFTISPSISQANAVVEGGRNLALTKLLGSLIGKGKTYEDSLTEALNWNESLASPLDESEVRRTHQSVWKTHLRNHPDSADKQIAPIQPQIQARKQFTLIPASDLLATQPPPREWLLSEFLPKKIVASIIAAGGTGKSFLAMHIAVALAAGSSLFSKYIASAPSKVVFISGEDDKIELQRRLHAITQGMPANLVKSISSNIQFIDLADSFELFTYKPPSGEVNMTTVPVDLVNAIKQKMGDEVGLVIVDPVSRFRGGEENSAADTTRFVQSLQYIRDQLNATVLTLHHVNKGAKTNGSGQNNARGSSAFIDGVRLVYELNTMSEEDIKKQYGASGVIPRLMTLNSVKSNYGKHIEPLTLSKRVDGSLELFTIQAGQHQKLAILHEVKVSKLTKTQFKQNYGGATGKFGLAEKSLLDKLNGYEKEGLIVIPNRDVMKLTQAGEDLLVP